MPVSFWVSTTRRFINTVWRKALEACIERSHHYIRWKMPDRLTFHWSAICKNRVTYCRERVTYTNFWKEILLCSLKHLLVWVLCRNQKCRCLSCASQNWESMRSNGSKRNMAISIVMKIATHQKVYEAIYVSFRAGSLPSKLAWLKMCTINFQSSMVVCYLNLIPC